MIQKEEKSKEAANQNRGTRKAAIVKDSTECRDLIVCSVYDTKPVHMMSTVAEMVEWIEKKRSVCSAEAGTKVSISYLRLNLIDDYNNNMNNIDLADQLRNCYQFNH